MADDWTAWCADDDVIVVTSRGVDVGGRLSSTLFSAVTTGVAVARRFFLGGVSGDDEEEVTLLREPF